jgi:hypothetical protein
MYTVADFPAAACIPSSTVSSGLVTVTNYPGLPSLPAVGLGPESLERQPGATPGDPFAE